MSRFPCVVKPVATILFLTLSTISAPLQEVDLASTTAWTLDGVVKPVPGGGWNAQGIDRKKDNVVYQRSITIPTYTAGNVVKILFGAVNHGADVYLDNNLITRHEGPMMPFEADITDKVAPNSTHTLKVIAFSMQHYNISKTGGQQITVPTGMTSTLYTTHFSQGITKYVKLAVYPQVYISDYFVRPSVASKQLSCEVWLRNAGNSSRTVNLTASFSSWNKDPWPYPQIQPREVTLAANSTTKVTLGPVAWNLGTASYWWPNIPFREEYKAKLHYVHLGIQEQSATLDTSRVRFGFVEWTEGPYYYKVNGVRIESQTGDGTNEDLMGLYDGYSTHPAFLPPTGPTTGCPETWKRYMRLGVNTNRTHQSTPTPYMMDAADEVGHMLIPETGIRGSFDEQAWGPSLPAAQREMAILCRNHPSVCRYSLQNEWKANENGNYQAMLVDSAYAHDPTRPLTMTEWNVGTNFFWTGKSGARARCMNNYPGYDSWSKWKATTGTILAIGEHSYSDWDKTPCGANDITRVGDRGLEHRRRDIVYSAIWTLTLAWPNFLEGQTASKFSHQVFHGDRVDGINGWGSDTVRWVQRALDPYLVLDSVLQNENSCFSSPWPKTVPSYSAAGQTINRYLTIINGGFSGNRMAIYWDARWDSPAGRVADAGAIDPIPVEPGFRATKPLTFAVPAPAATRDTVAVGANDRIMYTENRIYFNVGTKKLYLILKSVLKDAQTPTATAISARAGHLDRGTAPFVALSRTIAANATGGRAKGAKLYSLSGRQLSSSAAANVLRGRTREAAAGILIVKP